MGHKEKVLSGAGSEVWGQIVRRHSGSSVFVDFQNLVADGPEQPYLALKLA